MNKDINKNIILFRSALKSRELKITNIIIKIIPNINRKRQIIDSKYNPSQLLSLQGGQGVKCSLL